jgi:hypothetical protein
MRRPKVTTKRRTRGLTKIKRTEITRVTRGVLAAGLNLRGVEVDPISGKFRVLVGDETPADANSWDEVLTNAEDAKRPA